MDRQRTQATSRMNTICNYNSLEKDHIGSKEIYTPTLHPLSAEIIQKWKCMAIY